ncbi:MAG: ABC-F family ATP-binding cassette domain-containing protein [Parabacteroides sp.]|jgi:ATP-binding cassette subfamily F protein 3|uniref:Putative ABC transporter ATP-binding protein YheS n=2 Tax=root TaxID=1 RepID=A0A644VY20_9ZZZZ|nr:ABC-F family ATP-binding cassette domain-containing protein [Parabacteroides sp.]MDD3507064.1 ABC-F family ATP-binding cassette domain-containing protein [Parabacteroides sp.]HML71598.1 ABC-F family ATP-binding cassette domain-containing protein [Macellibacteroides fermentans]
MISVDGLTVEFGGSTLFADISFVINEKDRIALMGKNGAGKSTLLKILAGVREPSRGKISAPKDTVIAYLPQHLMTEDGRTVFEETAQAFSHLHEMESEIEAINKELETRTDYDSEEYYALIERVSVLSEKFYSIEETNYDADIEKTLLGLGFKREDFNRQTSDFSGGWRMRIELAKLLLKKPDVILLDEPTNHLDIESIQWLEDFLINSAKAVVLISHDRAFVDHITTRTIEVTMGRIYDYKVNYSSYLNLRKERREQQQKAFDEQQKFIAETKEFIERFKGTYSKTLQVQSRVKMLEKLELLEVDEEDTSALRLKFPPSPRSGNYPVIIENLSKSYGDHTVFKNANVTIERGDKIAFVGKNGEGKSTLVKCIMKEIGYDGTLTLGHNVMIGYFAQNQASLLDENLTVFQTIDDVAIGDIRNKIRDLLGAFMFGGESSTKKVKVLSGGERTRLAMIKLLLEPVNLLILDEPTNHLDMKTKDILKSALKDFDGTLIVVSHDRDFLDGLVTKVYEFGNKKVTEHLEGIYEFLQRKKLENLQELERKN